jgi:hypothetical protein
MKYIFLFCFLIANNTLQASHYFTTSLYYGLNLNTIKSSPDKVLLHNNFSASFSFTQKNNHSLGAITSLSIISNSTKYKINQYTNFSDNKLKARLCFAISLKQKGAVNIYSGIFATATLTQSPSFNTHNDSYNSQYNFSTEMADNFFETNSHKVNAGLSILFNYSPIIKSKQRINFSCSLFQNILREYQSKMFISKLLTNYNYISNGINPLISEINFGIGLNF